MTTYTDTQLQLALAKKLPELTIVTHLTCPEQTDMDGNKHSALSRYEFRWKDKGNWPVEPEITPCEWDWVTRTIRVNSNLPIPFSFKTWQEEAVWVLTQLGEL